MTADDPDAAWSEVHHATPAGPWFGGYDATMRVARWRWVQHWRTRTLWVVVYPEWVGVDGEVGWAVVDAATGLQSGYEYRDPLEP